MNNTILLIDDSPEVFEIVSNSLQGTGVEVLFALTATEARKYYNHIKLDLILLDISLPDTNGLELCKEITFSEANHSTPIFFLTADHNTETKVIAFETGAYDYIQKPFQPSEFRARILANLKRKSLMKENILQFGNLIVNIVEHKAFIDTQGNKKNLDLTPIEFKLLSLFARNPDKTFSRENVLENIWGKTNVYDRTIDTHIYSLRKKLNNYNNCVESVIGVGYRFNPNKATSNART